jgi:hypothetical protein
MPHYFLHLRSPSEDLLDSEGTAMPEGAVASAALTAARDCMAHDIRAGRLDFKFRIEVQDQDGKIVHTLPFAEAVNVPSAWRCETAPSR